jgi:RNA polymerase sigma-70 factor (ECF subfamily)
VNEAKQQPSTPSRLLEAVRRRDPEALAEFFEAHFDRLYNLAFRLVGEHSLAEDVLQEVFLKVHRAAAQLDPDRDPGPWLATITRNACREQWRGRRRHVEGKESIEADLPDDGSTSAEAETLRNERERRVGRALMRLPEGLREVVVLRDFHGLAHEEVAGVVGAKIAAVRKRYSRALAELRHYLEASG